jgi:hypothetical protein
MHHLYDNTSKAAAITAHFEAWPGFKPIITDTGLNIGCVPSKAFRNNHHLRYRLAWISRAERLELARISFGEDCLATEPSSSQQTDINLPFITADSSGPKHARAHWPQCTSAVIKQRPWNSASPAARSTVPIMIIPGQLGVCPPGKCVSGTPRKGELSNCNSVSSKRHRARFVFGP